MRAAVGILVVLGLSGQGACGLTEGLSRYQRVAESWVGASPAELSAAWGAWDGARDLGGGARQVVYSRSDMVAGAQIGCEARFTVSRAGVVTAADVSGTIGGCRQLLGNAPVRPR